MEKLSKIFVFFEGKIDWWVSYKIPGMKKIRFVDVVSDFLQKLEEEKEISLKIDDINVSFYFEQNMSNVVVTDLKEPIPKIRGNDFEILIQQKERQPISHKPSSQSPQTSKFIQIGQQFAKLGETTNAISFFQVSGINGDFELAKLYSKLGAYDKLPQLLPRLFQYFPGNIDVLLMHCKILENHGKYQEALERYVRMARCSDKIEIFIGASKCYLKMNDFLRSDFRIRQALNLNDYNPDAIRQYCIVKLESSDFKSAAIAALRHPKAYELLAEIAAVEQGQEELRDLLFNSRTIDSNMVFTMQSVAKIAKIIFKQGKVDFAKRILENVESIEFCVEAEYQLLKIAFYERDKVRFSDVIKKFSQIPNMDSKFPYFYISEFISYITTYMNSRTRPPKSVDFVDFPKGSIPYVKVWMLCVVFLFSYGRFGAALDMRSRFPLYFNLVAQTDKIHRLKTMFMLSDMTQTVSCHGKKRLAFVGDEYAGAVCPLCITATANGNADGIYNVEQMILPGLSIFGYFTKNSGMKKIFNRLFEKLVTYDIVVFCLGSLDCLFDIHKAIRDLKYDSVDQAVTSITKLYSEFISSFCQATKGKVFVHPAIPLSNDTAPIVGQFNKKLLDSLSDKNIFLDIFSDDKQSIPKVFDIEHKTHIGTYRFHIRNEIESKLMNEQK